MNSGVEDTINSQIWNSDEEDLPQDNYGQGRKSSFDENPSPVVIQKVIGSHRRVTITSTPKSKRRLPTMRINSSKKYLEDRPMIEANSNMLENLQSSFLAYIKENDKKFQTLQDSLATTTSLVELNDKKVISQAGCSIGLPTQKCFGFTMGPN